MQLIHLLISDIIWITLILLVMNVLAVDVEAAVDGSSKDSSEGSSGRTASLAGRVA
jgi:hypothetical protein